MPNIFQLWEEGKLGKGEYIKIPIQKREITLPQIVTGEETQTVTTKNTLCQAGEDSQLTSCICVSTGKLHNHNSQLLLLGEVLPIPVTLTAYCGAINGSVAINLTCAALLSLPNQLISARSINLEHIKNYRNEISNLGEYNSQDYWVEDYISRSSKPGKSISCGLCYIDFKKRKRISELCEAISSGTINGEKVKETTYIGETYTKFIRPVYYVDVLNPALEMKFEKGAWVIKTE